MAHLRAGNNLLDLAIELAVRDKRVWVRRHVHLQEAGLGGHRILRHGSRFGAKLFLVVCNSIQSKGQNGGTTRTRPRPSGWEKVRRVGLARLEHARATVGAHGRL